jgi:hypothetical protein
VQEASHCVAHGSNWHLSSEFPYSRLFLASRLAFFVF